LASELARARAVSDERLSPNADRIHPAWRALIEYCRDLQHGDIEKLRIQDGLPVIAEVITKKVKFTK
jgi:hypothetical protein